MDDPKLRILSRSILDDAAQYNISASDIQREMAPIKPRVQQPSLIDFESQRPFFGWLPLENVKRTFQHCTQNMRMPPSTHLQKRFKSPNPGANLFHRREPDTTDMIFSDTAAIDGGETRAHIFVGLISRITDVFKVKSGNDECFLGALQLQDRVRKRGAPTKLLADDAPLYRGWKITKYLRDRYTSLWQCEAKHQHQNFAENCYQLIKRMTNRMMDRFAVPAVLWFLCMTYVCYILNNSVDPHIGDGTLTPFIMSNFEMSDISPILVFTFYQPVYVLLDEKEQHFPNKSKEVRGHFAGISENIGHKMSFLILLDETQEIVSHSLVRSALDTDLLNHRLEANDTSDVHPTIQAKIMRDIEHQQTTRNLEKLKRQSNDLSSSIDRARARLDPDLHSDDSVYDESQNIQNKVVHLRDDGEFNPSKHPEKPKKDKPFWKEFEVPLLDDNGNEQLNDDGTPITIIARDPKSLQSTVFLTDPDDNGEQRRARVVEITGNWEDYNKEVEERHQMLKDLEFRIVYDRPSHLKKDGESYDFDRDNPDERDSAFDDILTYNEVVGYLNKEVTNEDGEYWAF